MKIDHPIAENQDLNTQSDDVKCRVLVVDDSKLVRLKASKILSQRFDLILAENGEDAWAKISSDKSIQLVFTDLGMPELDGFGLIQRVRASQDDYIRNLPMIVITGASDNEEIKQKIFAIGATDFITKPFNETVIIARTESHTGYRRLNKTLQDRVNIDALTGVLNSKGLSERLVKDISFVNRHSESLAFMLFELDNFESILSRVRKSTSETIIKAVAKLLNDSVRKEDSIGRDGIAEFSVILPFSKPEGVFKLSKRICSKISTFKLKINDETIVLSASIGLAVVSQGVHADIDNLRRCAEGALANAKALGTGKVQLLTIDEGEAANVRKEGVTLSIDALLDELEQGHSDNIQHNMEQVLTRLSPLLALLNEKQRKSLFASTH